MLPASAAGLPSEYETLTANLAAVYPGSLGALQENASQQDITYLANKTGWDARAVALAALADQFSQITAPSPQANADAAQTPALSGADGEHPAGVLLRAVPGGPARRHRQPVPGQPGHGTGDLAAGDHHGVIPQALARRCRPPPRTSGRISARTSR